jgi:ribosomal protein S18 acetylase RimI-like enzyme
MPSSSHARAIDPVQATSAAVLDSPIWRSLSSSHAYFCEGDERAKRYPASISPLAATVDSSTESYLRLAELLYPEKTAALFLVEPASALPGLEIVFTRPTIQMVWESGNTAETNPGEVLDSSDAQEMLELAELTKPGPFAIRTVELGTYLGVRQDGKLVAMAGERLRIPGWTEISAVCTHPDHRGHGYASALVLAVAAGILRRGEVPFLHVAPENDSAIHVYEKLGFRTRRALHLTVVRGIK